MSERTATSASRRLRPCGNSRAGVSTLIRAYCDERMRFLRSLTNAKTGFPVNGRGWTMRLTGRIRRSSGRISLA